MADYRQVLKTELETRCQANPRYSLRAFARDLGIAPARLSDILNGKQGLSRIYAEKISRLLGLSESEKSYFCDLIESQHARSKAARKLASIRLAQTNHPTQSLQMDSFKVIADWYHFAILELTSLSDFQSDPHWIAQQLGLKVHVVKQAIERLKRLDLLEESQEGRLSATDGFTASPDGIPSDAIKKFHKQVLEKALEAITFQTLDERDFSSITLAFDSSQMKKAKELIKNFRRNFSKNLTISKKDSLYNLSIYFFKLNQGRKT